jgi:hypothetical protein
MRKKKKKGNRPQAKERGTQHAATFNKRVGNTATPAKKKTIVNFLLLF